MNIDRSQLDLKRNPECEHLGLVFDICHRYFNLYHRRIKGLDFDDLVIIGYMALKKAWEGYIPQPDKEFAAYAGKIIRDWLKKAINNQGEVYTPKYINYEAWRVESGRGVSGSFESKDTMHECLKQAIQTRRMKKRGMELVENVSTQQQPDILADKDELNYALRFVNARAHEIISLRYGLTGGDPKTLDEVSRMLNVSRQWVQQIESEALSKMRAALVKSKERMDNV